MFGWPHLILRYGTSKPIYLVWGGQVFAGGYVWREAVADGDNSQLHQLDQIIMTTSRTTRLVGSIEEKQITYVTRSAVLGFPDYTTVGVYHGLNGTTDQRYFEINGRLRFGQSDLGVNAKRIKGWVADLKAGG